MKPIVIVCGANHSKTSMLMEKLVELNNPDYWFGEFDHQVSDKTPYKKYENKQFSHACKSELNFKEYKTTLLEALENIPQDKIAILKYPRSIFVMDKILKVADSLGREVRIIYVLREIGDTIVSTYKKTLPPNVETTVLMDIRNYTSLIMQYSNSLNLSFRYHCMYVPHTYFENDIYPEVIDYIER